MQALAIKRPEAIQGYMPQTRKRKTVQVQQSPDHETSADAAAITPMPIKPAKKKSKSGKKGGSAKKTPKANIDAAKELQWHCTVAGCGQTFTNATGLSNHVRAKHKTTTPAKTNAKEPKKKTGPKAKVDCLKLFIDPLPHSFMTAPVGEFGLKTTDVRVFNSKSVFQKSRFPNRVYKTVKMYQGGYFGEDVPWTQWEWLGHELVGKDDEKYTLDFGDGSGMKVTVVGKVWEIYLGKVIARNYPDDTDRTPTPPHAQTPAKPMAMDLINDDNDMSEDEDMDMLSSTRSLRAALRLPTKGNSAATSNQLAHINANETTAAHLGTALQEVASLMKDTMAAAKENQAAAKQNQEASSKVLQAAIGLINAKANETTAPSTTGTAATLTEAFGEKIMQQMVAMSANTNKILQQATAAAAANDIALNTVQMNSFGLQLTQAPRKP